MKNKGLQLGKNKSFTSLIWVRVIRQGLVSLIPVLLIGAFSLVIKSFPIPLYQDFIKSWQDGFLFHLVDGIYNISFGLLSVYMTITIGYHYTVEKYDSDSISCIGCSLVSLASFIIITGYSNLSIDTLGPKGMFPAIICALIASHAFCRVLSRQGVAGLMTDGSDVHLRNAVSFIKPMLVTLVLFEAANQLILLVSGGRNAHELFLSGANWIFTLSENGFLNGLLFVVLSSLLWFFGIHGSDVLEGVCSNLFTPNVDINAAVLASGQRPNLILTKQFFDMFVLMGGCGSAICLLLALLLFSRRKSNRQLAKMAAFPMLFNINEIMVFGLPIIYNPIILVPFLCTPVICYVISYLAMTFGLVPVVTASVEWTTPVLLGGYMATGSIAGSLLQLFNLALGVIIYRPFVLMYDQERLKNAKEDYDKLVEVVQQSEASRTPVMLTQLGGGNGTFAKALSADLKDAIKNGDIKLYYQPQYKLDGSCLGAEALMRWRHPVLGMVYPPLILKLADENGLLENLEKFIVSKAIKEGGELWESTNLPLKISVNVTGISIQQHDFETFLLQEAKKINANISICIELTEQAAVQFDEELKNRLVRLRKAGYHFAIDDFSMGNTSMQYLQCNYFDMVKLDGALVKRSLNNSRDRKIIESIINLSHSLGFEVLAEYISTEDLRSCMEQVGCTLYQGWLYAPALELDKLEDRLLRESGKEKTE